MINDTQTTILRLPNSTMMLDGEACPEVVALLEEWLEAAKRGEFRHVLLAGVKPNFIGTRTEWAGVAGADDCLAAAAGLFTRMQASWLESLK